NWDYVSMLHGPGDSESETTLDIDDTGNIIALVRKKWQDRQTWMVQGSGTSWQTTQLDVHLSGEHFFEIGGQTFVASREYLTRDQLTTQIAMDSGSLANLGDPVPTYSMIYKFTDDHQLIPWVVLDSMGDNGYPFLVETPDSVLVAYY